MLGNLLRSNQFPEWLEAAALDTLVADASLRLAELSNGQFELTHRNGEFFVIDHADADSQRGVRTLSGGETFQASLALALALSTQLSSMAAAGAARLDSIFLDEGFGTLDESTLEIVAATLESLAQGDRMVGVVTHVAALAERVPVRFVVNRDSRTSSIVPGNGMTPVRPVCDGRFRRPSTVRDELLRRRVGPDLRHQPRTRGGPRRVLRRGRRRGRGAREPLAAHLRRGGRWRRRARCCSSTGCDGSRPGCGSTTSATAHPRRTRRRRSAPPTRPASCVAATPARTSSAAETRRGLFTVAPHAEDIVTSAGPLCGELHAQPDPKMPLVGDAFECPAGPAGGHRTAGRGGARERGDRTFAERRRSVGGRRAAARAGPPAAGPRVHQEPPGRLPAGGAARAWSARCRPASGHRCSGSGKSWDRYSWYLRLPCLPSAPWAGIVRVECSPDLPVDDVVALANLSQGTLVRFASTEYKDARAPQNLYPIAGLERELRRRLGDSRLLYRALRVAAATHRSGEPLSRSTHAATLK